MILGAEPKSGAVGRMSASVTAPPLDLLIDHALALAQFSGEQIASLRPSYRAIVAHLLEVHARQGGRSLVLGLCGSQGSGKSTMAQVLRRILCDAAGLKVAILSLDDLYLSRADRIDLAERVHPLLRTRGVPGTHDIELGIDVIRRLVSAELDAIIWLPRFDKARDDRRPRDEWEAFYGRADIILFEGWCVGANPQDPAKLAIPVNVLERDCDPQTNWRNFVNDQLAGPYQSLFALLDHLMVLHAPGFEIVASWRKEQERKLAISTAIAAPGVMCDDQIDRFVMHYERLTRHMLEEMPARADLLVTLDNERRIIAIERSGLARPLDSST